MSPCSCSLRACCNPPWPHSVAALLFAVHPIHTEVVANIVGRAEILSALLVLASLGAYLRFLDGPRHRLAYGLSLLAFTLGPFAKESTLTALPMLAVLHHWREPAAPWRRRVLPLIPFVLSAFFYIGVRVAITGALTYTQQIHILDNPLAHVPWWIRVQTALPILWDYVSLLTVPIVLSSDYSYAQVPIVSSAGDPRFVAAVLTFSAAAVLLIYFRRRLRPLILGLVLTGLAISLTANVLFAIGTIKAERLLYLPSFGWCLACGWLAASAARHRPRATAALISAVLALFAARTWVRNYDWKDNSTLYRSAIRTSPNSAKVLCTWGILEALAERPDEALHFQYRALEILPTYPEPAYQIGSIYYRAEHRNGAALHWFEHSLDLLWEHPRAHLDLGMIRYSQGEFAAAEAAFRTGLRYEPTNPLLLIGLSATRLVEGDRWEAVDLLRRIDALPWMAPEYRSALAERRSAVEQDLAMQSRLTSPARPRHATTASAASVDTAHAGG